MAKQKFEAAASWVMPTAACLCALRAVAIFSAALERAVNDRQTTVVVIALIAAGAALAFAMLNFDLVDSGSRTRVGVYTEFGITGFILGYVVPVCLWALAVYLYFRGPGQSST